MRFFVLIFLFINAGANAAIEHQTKSQILADHPAGFYTLTANGRQILATIHHQGSRRMPREELSLWIEQTQGYKLLNRICSGIGESFDQPRGFTAGGLSFLNVSTTPAGSGGFVEEQFFWLAPDETLHAVEFQQASETFENLAQPGEVVLTGGEKEFFLNGGEMKFEFYLAHEGDPHCCPTAGVVKGTYKLVGHPVYDFFKRQYTGKMAIAIDKMAHETDTTTRISSK